MAHDDMTIEKMNQKKTDRAVSKFSLQFLQLPNGTFLGFLDYVFIKIF